jgi:hypothetical protein
VEYESLDSYFVSSQNATLSGGVLLFLSPEGCVLFYRSRFQFTRSPRVVVEELETGCL